MLSKKRSCYKCPDRWAKEIDGVFKTCHSTCKRYAEDQEKDKDEKEAQDKQNAHAGYVCMIHNRCADIKNKRRKSGC